MNKENDNNVVLQVGVKALLKNKEGKYLLVRRNPDKYPEVGAKWDIVGGRIHPGTALLENLKREIMEETQLELTKELVLVSAQDILRIEGRHVVRLTYVGEIDGEPILDEEHDEYGWFTMSDMKTMSDNELDIYFKELLDGGFI